MKLLLITIALLLSGMVWGQNITEPGIRGLFIDTDAVFDLKPGTLIKDPVYLYSWTDSVELVTWPRLIESWKAYEDYCYADSIITRQKYWDEKLPTGLALNGDTIFGGFVWRYNYSEPTPSGYVKWLEKLLE